MEKVKKMIWGILIILGGIGLDQITKLLVRVYLQPKGEVPVIKNFFSFTYVENRGGAWGIFTGKLWLFILITVAALAVLTYFMKDFDLKNNAVYSVGIALLIAGTLGNFIDRVVFNFVTDFLDFKIFGYDFPVFNVADICITIGVILLIIKILFLSSTGSSEGVN